ncbi:MAG: 6-bladed beta-propeller [Candidatus Fermentibacteria bacterium]
MKVITAIALAALLVSCGGEEPTVEIPDEITSEIPTVYLAPVDSIGIEIGDSTLVMGAIEGLAYGPDGNIAVLDCARACIRIYSPEGEYIRQIGRRGNGPGELQSIAFLGISEDGHIYLTGDGSEILGVHQFDYYTGEWLGSFQSTGTPPTCIEGAEDSLYIRKDLDIDTSSGEPLILINISKYSCGGEEPVVTYIEDTVPFFGADDMASMIELIWYGYDVAADFSGNTYIAPRSTEEAVVIIYGSDGMETGRIELDLEPVLRTEEELEMERMILTAKMSAMDMNQMPTLEPDPYKPLIRGLEIDGEGNIWVQHGGSDVPAFSVYSSSGDLMYYAEVTGDHPDGNSWRFYIDGSGILAYAEDPIDGYQKVYMLQIVQ